MRDMRPKCIIHFADHFTASMEDYPKELIFGVTATVKEECRGILEGDETHCQKPTQLESCRG